MLETGNGYCYEYKDGVLRHHGFMEKNVFRNMMLLKLMNYLEEKMFENLTRQFC